MVIFQDNLAGGYQAVANVKTLHQPRTFRSGTTNILGW